MTCIVCGDAAARELFVAEDWSLAAVRGTFRYVRCDTCDTVRVDPPPTDAQLAQAYPERYVGTGAAAAVLRRTGDLVGRGEARRLVVLAKPAGRALDAGCGTAPFSSVSARPGGPGRCTASSRARRQPRSPASAAS